MIRENLVAALEEMLGLTVLGSAEDEPGAVQWMKTDCPDCDLMIIDIFLKSGTGLNVLKLARALRPASKLIVLTNYATADMRRRCLQLGADKVFDKSAELDELVDYCRTLTP